MAAKQGLPTLALRVLEEALGMGLTAARDTAEAVAAEGAYYLEQVTVTEASEDDYEYEEIRADAHKLISSLSEVTLMMFTRKSESFLLGYPFVTELQNYMASYIRYQMTILAFQKVKKIWQKQFRWSKNRLPILRFWSRKQSFLQSNQYLK
uniref:Sperm associated antigen 16 n=1 Tax=Felis catus TaxID=9685 RepID=A0ABI7Z3P9_FELCA